MAEIARKKSHFTPSRLFQIGHFRVISNRIISLCLFFDQADSLSAAHGQHEKGLRRSAVICTFPGSRAVNNPILPSRQRAAMSACRMSHMGHTCPTPGTHREAPKFALTRFCRLCARLQTENSPFHRVRPDSLGSLSALRCWRVPSVTSASRPLTHWRWPGRPRPETACSRGRLGALPGHKRRSFRRQLSEPAIRGRLRPSAGRPSAGRPSAGRPSAGRPSASLR